MSDEAVTFELPVNRVTREREAENDSAEPTFATEREIIVDEPADVQAEKNNDGDINPDTGKNRRRLPQIIQNESS